MALPVALWEARNPSHQKRTEAFFRRFADPNAVTVVGATKWTHTATGEPYYVCAFWTSQLTKRGEQIDAAKIQAAMDTLGNADIHIAFCDDPAAQFAAWGLEAPVSELTGGE